MKRISQFFLFLGLSFIFLSGCTEQSYENAKKQRMQIASKFKDGDPIVIGVSWNDASSDFFMNGVKLAVKEINEKGGVLNSPLQVVIGGSESEFSNMSLSENKRKNVITDIAKSFAANPHLIAVVGHSSSNTSLLASVVYQNNGILFFAPNSHYSKLTGHNFEYVFRTTSTNLETGEQVANYAAKKGYKNIAILHNREDSSTEFANAFAADVVEAYGANIILRRSFFDNTIDMTSLIVDLKNIQNLDAIFIAAHSSMSAKIYQKSRAMGMKVPIIGGENFDTKIFSDQIKQWEKSQNTPKSSIPTLFNRSTPSGSEFVKRFTKEYGQNVQPDFLAALGYDTISLLAHAIQRAQSIIPIEIATTLRYMDACKGVSGKYEFKLNGDLKSKPFYFKSWNKDHYDYEQVNDVSAATDNAKMETCNDIDRDKDSIPDNIDACQKTTKNEMSKGIILDGIERGCPVDSDQDNIPNYKDNCPDSTPEEVAEGVDSAGCLSPIKIPN